ncbi:hypothetical protein DPMN_049875 [Dreissena polymorpha]|nr:hypothetical protein DPMN_049875 [Dreissena polymorpha]
MLIRSHTPEDSPNLPFCKPFIYWQTERHLANGKTRSGNYRRFRIPSALYGDHRSAFLLH